MAFDATKLARVSNHFNKNIPALYMYTTTDTTATLDTADYFLSAINELNKGDVIIAATSSGGTLALGLYFVKDKSSTSIDVADVLALTATDTD